MKLALLRSPVRTAITRMAQPNNSRSLRIAPVLARLTGEGGGSNLPARQPSRSSGFDALGFPTPFGRSFRDIEAQMEDMMRGFGMSPFSETALQMPRADMSLAVDVKEEDSAFVITADAPGMKKDEIKVEVSPDRVLTISGERKAEEKTEDKEKGYVRIERSYGSFSRAFKLPEHIDVAGIKADLNEGVLQLRVPKSEVAEEKKTIAIDVGGEQ